MAKVPCTCRNLSGFSLPGCVQCGGSGYIDAPEKWTAGPVMQSLGIESGQGEYPGPPYAFGLVVSTDNEPGIHWETDIDPVPVDIELADDNPSIDTLIERLDGAPILYENVMRPADGSHYKAEGVKQVIIIRQTLYTVQCPRHEGDLLDPVIIRNPLTGEWGLVCLACVTQDEPYMIPADNQPIMDNIMRQVQEAIEHTLDRMGVISRGNLSDRYVSHWGGFRRG